MDPNKLDNLFKNKLGGTPTVEFNPQDWEEARLMLKNKDKNHPWFLLLLVLLGLVLNGWISHVIQEGDKTPGLEMIVSQEQLEMEEVRSEAVLGKDPERIENTEDQAESKELSNQTKGSQDEKSVVLSGGPSPNSTLVKIETESMVNSSNTEVFPGLSETIMEVEGELLTKDERRQVVNRTGESQIDPRDAINDPIESIPSGDAGLLSYERHETLNAQVDDDLPIKVEPFRRTRWGAALNLLVGPSQAVVNPIRGLSIGMTIDRFFSPDFYVGISPSLRLQFNETGFSKFQESLSYGFGADNVTYGLQASSIQYLRLPVYAGYLFESHVIEGGLAVDWLVSARGRLQEVNVDGQRVEVVEEFDKGWIDTKEMQSVTASLFMGYKYQWNQKLRIGIDLYYQFGTNYPGLPNDQSQALAARWYTGIQGTYYFKK